MYRLEEILSILEMITNTKKKRHIVGGVLLSFSILFGGLSVTAFLVREEEGTNDE